MREPVGLILSGGRGTRMGNVAKADLLLGDTRLLDRCIARLDPQVRAIAVNSNDPVTTQRPVIADTLQGHLGPLAGVLTGLEWAETQGASHAVSVAVDTPFFPCDLVPHLIMAGQSHPDGFAIAGTAAGDHATFGIWPVALRRRLEDFLTSGERKVRAFAQMQGAAKAMFPDEQAFFNINTPDDLAQAHRWL